MTLDDFAMPVARPLQPAALTLTMPPFISEWLDSPASLCCARIQHEGVVSWKPNATFVREVGDEAMLMARLEATQPGISHQVDYLICTAEVFLAVALHPDDRLCMGRLNGVLWSQVARPDAPDIDGWRCAEASAPVAVRCVRREEEATVTSAATASAHTLCTLRGRCAILPESRAVCTVLSLTPLAPSPTLAPIGFASWPMDEVCSALLREAQNDGASVSYDALVEMGLDLDGDALGLESEAVHQLVLPTE